MVDAQSTAGERLTSREYLAQQQAKSASSAYDGESAGSEPEMDEQDYRPNPSDLIDLPDSEYQQSRLAPGMYKPQPEYTVLEWQAPSRPFKQRNKRFFTTIIVIGLLVSLILFFAGQLLPIAVVFSIIFLVYVMSVVPPTQINYKISTFGIRADSELYYWEELGRFWFEEKLGQQQVVIETARFPGRLAILLVDQPKEVVEMVLAEVLLQEKPPLTQFEKVAEWLEKRVPLDFD
jgi:hypothetical protein